jgi:glycerate kinase
MFFSPKGQKNTPKMMIKGMPQMKFVFAPDSFKGTLTSVEAAELLQKAAAAHFPGAAFYKVPVADGGEGTVEAVVTALNGEYRLALVTGPLDQPVQANYGLARKGRLAVIEMAAASGLPLVPAGLRNPLKTTSRGTGELLVRAMDEGAAEILIGIGGSATNDGGMGLLSALGAHFYDAAGASLPDCGESLGRVAGIDLQGLHPGLKHTALTVICDVTNPLLGPTGAAAVYAPQKGAGTAAVAFLEEGMAQYAELFWQQHGLDIANFPGAGAAGGLGAALGGVLGAAMRPGIDAMLDLVDFDELITDADLVVTGEGRIDGQSVRYGKVVAGIARRCAKAGVPLAIIAGGMGPEAEMIFDVAFSSIMPTVSAAMPLEEALSHSHELFESASDRMFRFIKIGYAMGGH